MFYHFHGIMFKLGDLLEILHFMLILAFKHSFMATRVEIEHATGLQPFGAYFLVENSLCWRGPTLALPQNEYRSFSNIEFSKNHSF